MANITVTLDDEDKRQLTEFCDQIGVSVSTLFTIFSKKVIRDWEIPFKVGLDKPNRATIRAMKEGDKIRKNLDKVKVYDNVEEMWEELKKMKFKIVPTKKFKKEYKLAIKRGKNILELTRTGSHADLF